jgi:exosome complex RNA-binding protein Rrp4
MKAKVGDIVMPGHTVPEAEELAQMGNKKVVLGDGLRQENDNVIVSKGGLLCKRKPNIFYVDSYQKRYIPSKNDTVIGLVTSKTQDFFWVDINSSELASRITHDHCKSKIKNYFLFFQHYHTWHSKVQQKRTDQTLMLAIWCIAKSFWPILVIKSFYSSIKCFLLKKNIKNYRS